MAAFHHSIMETLENYYVKMLGRIRPPLCTRNTFEREKTIKFAEIGQMTQLKKKN